MEEKKVDYTKEVYSDIYKFEKITDSAIMINISKSSNTLYVIKSDNTLWAYNKGYWLNYGDAEPTAYKVMDDVKFIEPSYKSEVDKIISDNCIETFFYTVIIKTDDSLWQFEGENFDTLEKIADNVIYADTCTSNGLMINKNGELYIWESKNNNPIKLEDNVKQAKFEEAVYIKHEKEFSGMSLEEESRIVILKNDNSLWAYRRTGYPYVRDYKKYGKLGDNITDILGDETLFLKDNCEKIKRIIFPYNSYIEGTSVIYYDFDTLELEILYDINTKTPEIVSEVKITSDELQEYEEITKQEKKMRKELIEKMNDLEKCNNNISNIDEEIQAYEDYKEINNKKIIIGVYNAGKKGIRIITNDTEKIIFHEDKSKLEEISKIKYDIEDKKYEISYLIYKIKTFVA